MGTVIFSTETAATMQIKLIASASVTIRLQNSFGEIILVFIIPFDPWNTL